MTTDVPERPSDLLAAHVRRLRRWNEWTADDLAARCRDAGAPEITHSVIASIETGRRHANGRRRRDVSVDELVTFAAVLGTAPGELLTQALGQSAAKDGAQ